MNNNLLKIRASLSLTQAQFADSLGISRTALFDAETGHVSIKLAKKIAELYGLNLFYVLGKDALRVLPESKSDLEALMEAINDVL